MYKEVVHLAINFDYFKEEFYKLTHVDLNQYHQEQLERRIRNFLSTSFSLDKTNDQLFHLAIQKLKQNAAFRVSIYEAITINHSYFFRNKKQWDQLLLYIKEKGLKRIKIWSAGCSSGEEPYTLAMLMDTELPDVQFEIYASDIDQTILKKAEKGVYDHFSLEREVDSYYWHRYFKEENDHYVLDKHIKRRVVFKEHNLLERPFENDFDVIICRNVLIYFSNEGKEIVFNHFSKVIKPDGLLFLGPTEQFFNSEEFGFTLVKPSFYRRYLQ